MKPLIVGLAVTVLYATFLIFQVDNNLFLIQVEALKTVSEDCSTAATLLYDMEAFKLGKKVFNQQEGNKAIAYLLKKNLNLDENLNPRESSYWTDQIDYYTTYYDDSSFMYVYHKDELIEKKPFSYNDLYTDIILEYKKTITEPVVIVTIMAGKGKYRLSFIDETSIIATRSSAYEYVDR